MARLIIFSRLFSQAVFQLENRYRKTIQKQNITYGLTKLYHFLEIISFSSLGVTFAKDTLRL